MPELYVGLMSGTSLDGVDAVLVDQADGGWRLVHCLYQPFQPQLRETILALHDEEGRAELRTAALAANQISHTYAAAIRTLLSQARVAPREVTAAGCHGQTIRHRPEAGYTIQLLNGALLAELSGLRVVCDFRSRDIAAGGQGAPLVPAFHHARFSDPERHRVIVNIGGIANITALSPNKAATGFDCGPGNILLDAWIMAQKGRAYDEDGGWAAQGTLDEELLARLLNHDFFRAPPPKSTGRETFNLAWLRRMLSGREAAVDVQTTALELTARTIARAIEEHCPGAQEIFVCGGGAHNTTLLRRLASLLPSLKLDTTGALGIDPDWVEALAFAWLARRALHAEPGNLPTVTGAAGPRVLGAIYPA